MFSSLLRKSYILYTKFCQGTTLLILNRLLANTFTKTAFLNNVFSILSGSRAELIRV